ncbi:hypothetical protein AB0F68_06520 [Micromonospora sp. NPDC023966]|uniref:hypothetical protein n=1 Tax=Micromonospora sp. NPDC023966 TaxID=3154699 RepID=UPI00340C1CBA
MRVELGVRATQFGMLAAQPGEEQVFDAAHLVRRRRENVACPCVGQNADQLVDLLGAAFQFGQDRRALVLLACTLGDRYGRTRILSWVSPGSPSRRSCARSSRP